MHKLWLAILLIASLIVGGCQTYSVTGNPQVNKNQVIPYTPEVAADNLDVPWELAFTGDGRIFLTERPGTVRVIQNGRLLPEPVISFAAPFISSGEGGLLGLAIDPAFAQNHYLYVYHTYEDRGQIFNRVLRLREQENRASIDRVLIDRIPGNEFHNGGRLKIGPDERLYITTGDAQNPALAQNSNSLAGKILRFNLDGTIPPDNPFPNSPVYSLGHRNPQGLAWSPATGILYSSEHGARAHDEINRIEPGVNYGWPLIQGNEQRAGMRTPLIHSDGSTWAPSGMTFVTRGPWQGRLLVANLRGEQLLGIQFVPAREPTIQSTQVLYQNQYGRLRNIVEGPDGSLYVLTNNRDGRGTARTDDDKIIRLRPR